MKVSVVIPTYNRRHVIAAAIDSVQQEGGGEVEVLVVDDGSDDGTVRWIGEAYADRPVRVLRNAGAKGPAGGRNTGIRAAQGDLIALLDSDDAFLPGHLAEAVAVFERFVPVDIVFGRAQYERNGRPEDYMGPNFDRKLALAPKQYVDAQVTVFSSAFFEHLLQYGCWFNLSTVVLRRAAAMELMNERLRISEDYEFWVRLSRTHAFACLHRPQVRYALHDENISFEADDSIEGHAPRLLQALEIMLAYPGLTKEQSSLIRRQMADIFFDWAYRSKQGGLVTEACGLHLRSLRCGRRVQNLVAIVKAVGSAVVRPRYWSED